jgi:hypothetical protein
VSRRARLSPGDTAEALRANVIANFHELGNLNDGMV